MLLRKIFHGSVGDGETDFIQDHHDRCRDSYGGGTNENLQPQSRVGVCEWKIYLEFTVSGKLLRGKSRIRGILAQPT